MERCGASPEDLARRRKGRAFREERFRERKRRTLRWEKWLAERGTRRLALGRSSVTTASCTQEVELAIRILEPRLRVGFSLNPRIVTRSHQARLACALSQGFAGSGAAEVQRWHCRILSSPSSAFVSLFFFFFPRGKLNIYHASGVALTNFVFLAFSPSLCGL